MASIPNFQQKNIVSLFTVLAWLGLSLLGLWLLYALRDLIPPFLVATIIAMTLAPEIDRLERRGMYGRKFSRGLAIGIIYFLFLALFALMVKGLSLVSIQMTELVRLHFGHYLSAPPAEFVDITGKWLDKHHVPAIFHASLMLQARHVPLLLANGQKWFGDKLPALAGGLAGNLVLVFIVPIIAFFILLDFNKILGKSLLLIPQAKREAVLTVVTDIIAVFGSYVRGVLTVMALDITVIFLVLWVAGLRDYALTLAITAGLLYTIPYFGALVSTILIGLVALGTHGLATAIVLTLVMIFIHQIVFDMILAPRVIGGSVNLHPLLTLLALMTGGTLFGIGGTLLAVPIAAAFQVVLVHLFPQFSTDVVAVRRVTAVVQATLAKDTEEAAPPARKDDDAPTLAAEVEATLAAAQAPPTLLPPVDAAKG